MSFCSLGLWEYYYKHKRNNWFDLPSILKWESFLAFLQWLAVIILWLTIASARAIVEDGFVKESRALAGLDGCWCKNRLVQWSEVLLSAHTVTPSVIDERQALRSTGAAQFGNLQSFNQAITLASGANWSSLILHGSRDRQLWYSEQCTPDPQCRSSQCRRHSDGEWCSGAHKLWQYHYWGRGWLWGAATCIQPHTGSAKCAPWPFDALELQKFISNCTLNSLGTNAQVCR